MLDTLKIIMNIFWFIIFGWIPTLVCFLYGCLMYIFGLGNTIGKGIFQIAKFIAFPINNTIIREDTNFKLPILINIIWFPFMLIFLVFIFYLNVISFFVLIFIPISIQFLCLYPFVINPNKTKVINSNVLKYRDMPPP